MQVSPAVTNIPASPFVPATDTTSFKFVSSNTSYYVATTGNDSADGLTPGTAFATIQKAVNVVSGLYIDSGVTVTIQLADGTYTLTAPLQLTPYQGGGTAVIAGNAATPSNVVLTTSSASSVYQAGLLMAAQPGNPWLVGGFRVTSSVAGMHGIVALNNAVINVGNVNFHTLNGGIHLFATDGAILRLVANYSITGNADRHLRTLTDAVLLATAALTCTLTGTPAFTSHFCNAALASSIRREVVTYSGSATGARYAVSENSIIYTGGGGANFFPGNSAGVSATGGQYL